MFSPRVLLIGDFKKLNLYHKKKSLRYLPFDKIQRGVPFKLVMVFPITSSWNTACYIRGLIHGIGRAVPNELTYNMIIDLII